MPRLLFTVQRAHGAPPRVAAALMRDVYVSFRSILLRHYYAAARRCVASIIYDAFDIFFALSRYYATILFFA